jgi:Fic family protein
MAIQGIKLLPVKTTQSEALKIFELLTKITQKVGRLSSELSHTVIIDSFIQILAFNESVQSTRIEGTQVTFTNAIEEKNNKNPRWEIREVLNYSKAMQEGIHMLEEGYPISSRMIKAMHKTLMSDGRGSTSASGEFRKIQNFIGPNNKIEDAVYIPVAANEINTYMENLEFFINGDSHDSFVTHDKDGYVFDENSHPIIKTAIMHAQFESIHPFLDGNGRLGRILLVLNLMKDDLLDKPVFFVSEELEKERSRYYDLLNGIRGDNPDWAAWILFFLNASERMADSLLGKIKASDDLAKKGISKLTNDSQRRIWLYTFSNPITTVAETADELGITKNTVRKYLNELVELDLIYSEKSTVRNKKYYNYDLLRILN